MSDYIAVAIKVKPVISAEECKIVSQWHIKDNAIFRLGSNNQICGDPYCFDHLFDEVCPNEYTYTNLVKSYISAALDGFNTTIFAYGQTSSGKTHIMIGSSKEDSIIQLSVDDIFKCTSQNSDREFLISSAFFEIYNEHIFDLLDLCSKNCLKELRIREVTPGSIILAAREVVVLNTNDVLHVMNQGNKNRKTLSTKANDKSSRSHVIFRITIELKSKSENDGLAQTSYLNFVDLAGSERVSQTKAQGKLLKEGVYVNKSLSVLGNVIRQLSNHESFISYRDSKLTRILQQALGGNAKCLLITTITVTVLGAS